MFSLCSSLVIVASCVVAVYSLLSFGSGVELCVLFFWANGEARIIRFVIQDLVFVRSLFC